MRNPPRHFRPHVLPARGAATPSRYWIWLNARPRGADQCSALPLLLSYRPHGRPLFTRRCTPRSCRSRNSRKLPQVAGHPGALAAATFAGARRLRWGDGAVRRRCSPSSACPTGRRGETSTGRSLIVDGGRRGRRLVPNVAGTRPVYSLIGENGEEMAAAPWFPRRQGPAGAGGGGGRGGSRGGGVVPEGKEAQEGEGGPATAPRDRRPPRFYELSPPEAPRQQDPRETA